MADKLKVSQAAPRFSTVAKGEIVTIFVGYEKKRYNIHKDIICHHSEYFRTAFNGRWKESDEGVTLEDVDPEVFNLFVHWLYAQALPNNAKSILRLAEETDPVYPMHPSRGYHAWELVLKCGMFGDRFLTPAFHHLAHNTFVNVQFGEGVDGGASGVSYATIIWAFDNLPSDSLILAMMVDLQCTAWNEEQDDEEEKSHLSQLPNEFLVAVMLKQNKIRVCDETTELSACDYHLHESEEKKKACPANGNNCKN
ncbi:uncharacterized protein J4E87_003344 [Alternaria ethzedia]|uniref:uncharacterized protein n=1 Tax=Alternaria ethzedia TaxID=181014 RepID=UPI0020C520E2|nr:uncharacterized protein J4E87_003344 [Alternaria ethzedia]KAI4629083.1 hypothetical protein J4E87_003344 [Alternaria ethzedia]